MTFNIGDEVLTVCPDAEERYDGVIGVVISTKGDYEKGVDHSARFPYVLDIFPNVGYAENELTFTPETEHSMAVKMLGEDYFA